MLPVPPPPPPPVERKEEEPKEGETVEANGF
jgi:hypothetical protein